MGKALYRKYRPRTLKEVLGQEHVTTTLSNAIRSGSISHAYLLTGPRGIGKTTVARILAHDINGLPYNDDSSHMDIIEIDAASNRRIDEIRELRDKINVAPTSTKYKVYVIDEVHMLTREAFNALLKTLEEPPSHVVFILATTELSKLPETIISRTQRYVFKPVDPKVIAGHLRDIATRENIRVTEDAIDLIAAHADGSFRDSISLLDQAASKGIEINSEDIELMIGLPPKKSIDRLLQQLLGTNDASAIVSQITDIYMSGYQPAAVAKMLGQLLRQRVIYGTLDVHQKTICYSLLEKLLNVPSATNPLKYLEIILLEFIDEYSSVADKTNIDIKLSKKSKNLSENEEVLTRSLSDIQNEKKLSSKSEGNPQFSPEAVLDDDKWALVLSEIKSNFNTLYGVLRLATIEIELNKVILEFKSNFHRKQISDMKNLSIIKDAIENVTGCIYDVECITMTASNITKPSNEQKQDDIIRKDGLVSTISTIFGGGELLES